MNQTPTQAAWLDNVLTPFAQYIFDDMVWYVCTRVDALVEEYQSTPKSESSKKTVYRTRQEIKRFRSLLMEIGQPMHDE